MEDDRDRLIAMCDICGKLFSKNTYRNRHLKDVHKLNSKREPLPDIKYNCALCGQEFEYNSSLQRHVNAVHSSIDTSEANFKCNNCSYKTPYKWCLKKHISKKHEIPKINNSALPFKCSLCNAKFSYLRNLRFHERKQHRVGERVRAPVKRKCPICAFISSERNRVHINSHFATNHNISMNWETHSFKNLKEFNEWKNKIEKQTITSFVKREFTSIRMHYECHRNGTCKTITLRKRQPKTIGSCKINAYCPSEIKVNIEESGQINVKYLPTHVGHKNELKYIRLTPEEKKSIASKPLKKIKTTRTNSATIRNDKNDTNNTYDEESNYEIDLDENEIEDFIENKIANEVSIETNTCENEETWKKKLKKKAQELVDYINDKITTEEQIHYAELQISQTINTLEVMASTSMRPIEIISLRDMQDTTVTAYEVEL